MPNNVTVSDYDEMMNIISSYNYELPLVVAEYFCYVYYRKIHSVIKINGKLFKTLLEYKNDVFFVFDNKKHNSHAYGVNLNGSDTNANNYIELVGVNFYIKNEDYGFIGKIFEIFKFQGVYFYDLEASDFYGIKKDPDDDDVPIMILNHIKNDIKNNKYTGVFTYRF